MQTALVTGAGGFLGRHFVQELVKRGYGVDQIDIKYAHDMRELPFIVPKHYNVVIHAAAHVGGRVDIEQKATYLGAYNLQLDGALFEWALRAEPDHVLYISSSAVYPISVQHRSQRGTVLHEDMVDLRFPELPDCTYGWTKLTGEQLAYEARHAGLNVHVVRPFSGYGTDQGVDYPFGAFLLRALERQDPFEIWGDGTQVRDWVHVDDVVNIALAVIDQDVPDSVNICTGRPTSFNELAQMFIALTGDETYRPELRHRTSAPTGVHYRVGHTGMMSTVCLPKITLEEGIERALRETAA